MATKKARKKKAKKVGPGHNSGDQTDMDEIRKIAKAQRLLDKKKDDFNKEHLKSHKDLTNRLEKAGMTRDEFKQPYADFLKIAECETDEDAKIVRENQKLFLANQRKIYDALSPGGQVDWIELIQDAEQIRKDREEAEREQAEAAAEAGEDAKSEESEA